MKPHTNGSPNVMNMTESPFQPLILSLRESPEPNEIASIIIRRVAIRLAKQATKYQ